MLIIAFYLLLAVVGFFIIFRKNPKMIRGGISVLVAILFACNWYGIWFSANDEWYITGQTPDTSINLILAIIFIGSFLICMLFVWKMFRVKNRLIAAICIAGTIVMSVGGIIGFKRYDDRRTLLSTPAEVDSPGGGRDISLIEYEPFRKNTLAKSLDEPSDFLLQDNLPRLEGATALYPLYAAFARAVYPEADYPVYSTDNFYRINNNPVVTCSTTSGAFERLIDGKADIIFLAGLSDEQRGMAYDRGLELKLTPIGREAFVFFVNKRNYISNLTADEIRGIYSGRITNWREVGGKNDPIKPYQRAKNSGSQTMLLEIMGDTPLMSVPESDYFDMMYEIYRAVAVYKNYKNALGYSFLFYINEMIADNKIKLLSIDGVEPTADNIANGTYPFSNSFYAITVVREPEDDWEAERIANTERFIEWILSPQGQSLVEKTGYVPKQ